MQVSLFLDPQEGMSYDTISRVAVKAEEHGFEGLYRSDHLTSTAGRHDLPATEAWATLAGLARETTHLQLGTLISPIGFRHPSLFAKLVSTVDEMSRGRTVVSIGTGWYPPEHELLGFPFDQLTQRFDQLEEYLEVLVRLWAAEGETYDGTSYRIGSLVPHPLTARRPGPWLIIGGHGRRRTPMLAARYADEYNIDWPSPSMCRELFAALDAVCDEVGRAPDSLRRSVLLGAVVGTDDADTERRATAAMTALGVDDTAAWQRANADSWTIGAPKQLAQRLQEYEDVGVDHVMLMLAPPDDEEMIALVAEQVLPAVGHRVR